MSFKLCFFGDSVGKGVVFDSLQNKYKFLKDNFVKLFSQDCGLEVSNYSSFGCTITKGQKVFQRHVKELESCDGVVLEFGGNDCDFNWAEVSERPKGEHLPNTPMDQFMSCYEELIGKVREQGKKPILMNLPPLNPDRFFATISKGLSAENILEYLGDVDRIYRWHEYYSNSIVRIGGKTNTPVIDVRSAFLERRDCYELLCDDGMHPNAKGHELISSVVSQYARELTA